jgi:hypothetical protein
MSFLFVFLSFWRKQYIGAFAYVRPAWFIADAQWVGLVSLLCLLTEWLVIPRRTLHSRRGTKRTVDYWYHSFVMPFYYSVWAPVVSFWIQSEWICVLAGAVCTQAVKDWRPRPRQADANRPRHRTQKRRRTLFWNQKRGWLDAACQHGVTVEGVVVDLTGWWRCGRWHYAWYRRTPSVP